MIQCGMAELDDNDPTKIRNGVMARTTGQGQPVFFVSTRDGCETVLDATQILRDFGWAPRAEELSQPGYRRGLLDAIDEIESEMAGAELEYADAEIARKTAHRVLFNARQTIKDRIAMLDA